MEAAKNKRSPDDEVEKAAQEVLQKRGNNTNCYLLAGFKLFLRWKPVLANTYPGKKSELLTKWNQVKNTPPQSLFTFRGTKKRRINFKNSKKGNFQLKITSLDDTPFL
jgi:hypothetical protein